MKTLLTLIPIVLGCQTPTGPDQYVWDVSGTVLGPNGPVTDAEVRFEGGSEGGWFGGGGEFYLTDLSDAEGRFSFHMVTSGCHAYQFLAADHPDYYQPMSLVLPRSPCPEGMAGVTIRLEPLGTLEITTTTLPRATLAVEYSFALEAMGSIDTPASAFWSIIEGPLPPGLTFMPWGVIGGTPTSTGTWSFMVEAVTPDTRAARAVLSIDVTSGPSI